jgi:dynein heavy chain
LKAVTGDPKRIEEVLLRVDNLVKPLQEVGFDPFEIQHKNSWKSQMEHFYKQVESIEGEAKMFIDESFQSLRSAEGAFDMLLNFKHIRSRKAINDQMMQKFKDILVQYEKEVKSKESFISLSDHI